MADTKIQCSCCGKSKKVADFYTSYSPIHQYYKRFPICKECIFEMVDEDDVRSILNMLRMLDKPFLNHLYEASKDEAKKQERSVFRTYMKNIVMRQNRDKTWEDSEFDEDYVEETTAKNIDVDEEVYERWRGWDKDKMKVLESKYQDLTSVYEHKTPIQRSIYRNIAVAQMQADDAIANGKTNDYQKLMKVISDLMNDAKIKPLQETSAEDGTLSTYGQWVAKIEEEEPCIDPKGEFKDVDGIMEYIQKWFVGHMKRILGLEADTSPNKKEDDDG